jgi:hypothetical protein
MLQCQCVVALELNFASLGKACVIRHASLVVTLTLCVGHIQEGAGEQGHAHAGRHGQGALAVSLFFWSSFHGLRIPA